MFRKEGASEEVAGMPTRLSPGMYVIALATAEHSVRRRFLVQP